MKEQIEAQTPTEPPPVESGDTTGTPAPDGASDSPPGPGDKPESLADALETVTSEKAEDSPPDENAESGDAAAAPVKDEAGGDDADGSLDVPFSKRPEWAEAVKLGGDAIKPLLRKLMGRETHLAERVRSLKPLADVVAEFKTYTGDEAGFTTLRQIVKTYATEPAASVPILEKMLADARERAGFVVTDADLKQRVADVTLDETAAVEIQKARAEAKRAKETVIEREQRARSQRQEEEMRERVEALNRWEDSIRERHPDFGDVTADDDPGHGLSVADQVFDTVRLKQMTQPASTAAELVAEAQRALKLALSRLTRPARGQRVVTSGGSSVTARAEPKNLQEALNAVPSGAR